MVLLADGSVHGSIPGRETRWDATAQETLGIPLLEISVGKVRDNNANRSVPQKRRIEAWKREKD